MKNKLLQQWLHFLETLVTGLLLFYFVSPSFFSHLTGKYFDAASYLLVAILIICYWKKFIYVITRDLALVLLLGMIATSIYWSALPEISSITIKAVLRTILFAACVATRYTIAEQMKLLTWIFGIATVLSLIFHRRETYNNAAFIGIFAYKNYLAIHMVLAAMLFLLAAFGNRRFRYQALTGLLMATALLFLSQGKGCYVIFLISIYLLPVHVFVKQQYKLRIVLLTSLVIVSSIIVFLLLINLQTILVDVLGKNTEFNGRTPIWSLCIEQALKRPWLGYGISGFWGSRESIVILRTTWAKNHVSVDTLQLFNSHNSYIEVLLQLGFIGFFLYAVNLLSTFTRVIYLWMSNPTIETFWMFQTVIILFLFNFTDNGGILSRETIWIIYVSISLSSAVWIQKVKINRQLRKHHSYEYNLQNTTLEKLYENKSNANK